MFGPPNREQAQTLPLAGRVNNVERSHKPHEGTLRSKDSILQPHENVHAPREHVPERKGPRSFQDRAQNQELEMERGLPQGGDNDWGLTGSCGIF